MHPVTLSELLQLATLTDSHARQLSGLSERQWRRYRNSGAPVPPWLVRLVLALSGDLGAIQSRWAGWKVQGDTLTSPSGDKYALGWFAALPGHFAMLAEERRQLRQRVDELERLLSVPPKKQKPRTVPGLVRPLKVISGGAS